MPKRQTSYPRGRTMLDEPDMHPHMNSILKHWLKQNQKWASYGLHRFCKRPDCVVHA